MNMCMPQIWSSIWPDVHKPVSHHAAMSEAARCLSCHDAPCTQSCPAGIDVREFIARIRSGNLLGAARVIRSANVFGASCGYICPTEMLCRKGCVQSDLAIPIDIGTLQRYAVESAGWQDQPQFPEFGEKHVAIVGAGPAGLAAAFELRLHGIHSTVFENHDQAGGLLRHAIPTHRLPRNIVDRELDWICSAGFSLELEHPVITISSFLEKYDALLFACGAGEVAKLRVTGEDSPFVLEALGFLKQAWRPSSSLADCRHAVVIGGGNTALDAAVTAKRLGAKRVTVLYRRDFEQMPAWPREIHEALFQENISLATLCQPVAIKSSKKSMGAKIECKRMQLGALDSSGRPRPVPIADSNFQLEADLIITAIGQVQNQYFGLDVSEIGGSVHVDEDGCTTTPRVFAAGDFVTGSKTVVEAVAAGKRAAIAIARQLKENS